MRSQIASDVSSRTLTIHDAAQARELEQSVRLAAARAARALADLLRDRDPIDVIRTLKFADAGADPLAPEVPINLLEQVHKTFMYLTLAAGVQHLLERHPDHAPYTLHFGRADAPDIISHDGAVVAEALAVVTPVHNDKVRSDLARLKAYQARYRYVFYYAHQDREVLREPDVQVVAVDI